MDVDVACMTLGTQNLGNYGVLDIKAMQDLLLVSTVLALVYKL